MVIFKKPVQNKKCIKKNAKYKTLFKQSFKNALLAIYYKYIQVKICHEDLPLRFYNLKNSDTKLNVH